MQLEIPLKKRRGNAKFFSRGNDKIFLRGNAEFLRFFGENFLRAHNRFFHSRAKIFFVDRVFQLGMLNRAPRLRMKPGNYQRSAVKFHVGERLRNRVNSARVDRKQISQIQNEHFRFLADALEILAELIDRAEKK